MKSFIFIILSGLCFNNIESMHQLGNIFDKAKNFLTLPEQDDEEKVKKINELEKKITITLRNYSKPTIDKDIATIPFLEELVKITNDDDAKHKDYVKKLKSLKELRTHIDLHKEVQKLKQTGDKEQLCDTYTKLMNLYESPKQKEKYKKYIEILQQQITQEHQSQEQIELQKKSEEKQKIKNNLNIQTLTATINATLNNKQLDEFKRVDKLTSLLKQRAVFYKMDLKHYESDYANDVKRIAQLQRQAITLAPTETIRQALLRQLPH